MSMVRTVFRGVDTHPDFHVAAAAITTVGFLMSKPLPPPRLKMAACDSEMVARRQQVVHKPIDRRERDARSGGDFGVGRWTTLIRSRISP